MGLLGSRLVTGITGVTTHNYDPFLGTPNIRCRIIIGIQTGTIILTTSHMGCRGYKPTA